MSSVLKVDEIQNTSGTTGLTIASNGVVSPKVPVFSVSLTSNTPDNLASNNYHLVISSTIVHFDNTSAWNTANEKWQPQTAGYYYLNCTVNSRNYKSGWSSVIQEWFRTYMNHHLGLV